MSTEPQRDCLTVVLVSPRNPLNIGAAARAMANFGFAHLSVVAPYEPHWREAKSAVGAQDLLSRATVHPTLQQAVAHCTLVLGTGALARRTPQQPVVPLPDLAPLVQEEFARTGRDRQAPRIALVFGPEKRGLTREDLTHCHALVEIPTSPTQPSMNLAQAVAVCLYELSTRLFASPAPIEFQPKLHHSAEVANQHLTAARANSAQLDLLAAVIEETMAAAHYSPAAMRAANAQHLRLLLRRLNLADPDARRILGLFRRILHRLKSSA